MRIPVVPPRLVPVRRAPAVLAGLVALLLAVAGCSAPEPESDPRQVAAQLASYLSAGHVWGEVPLTAESEPAALAYPELVMSAAGAFPTVTVGQIDPYGAFSTRTAVRLDWSWDVVPGAQPWTYSTRADLIQDGKMWRANLQMPQFHPELTATSDRFEVRRSAAERAPIVDRAGTELITRRTVQRIGIDKPSVDADAQEDSARALARAVDVDPDTFVKKLRAAGPKAFVEAIVLREEDVSDALAARIEKIRGGRIELDDAYLAPTREFARPLLGTVGPATDEIVAESKGRIDAGDIVGLSGLSRRYDERLRGVPETSLRIADGPELWTAEAARGKPLKVTLDADLQARAERLLAETDSASAIVAIRPSDQQILVAASGPGGDGESTATMGRYPPGSTFKIVTVLALLRAGLSPDSPVECTRQASIDGRKIGNYSDYPESALGTITLREAFAQSCNTALINASAKISSDDLRAAAEALGLNHDADLGYPFWLGEAPPTGPGLDQAVAMIGQGEVLATPLGMASVAASVAAGERVTPRLITDAEVPPLGEPARPLTAKEADTLRGLMRSVVTDGSARMLDDLPGEVGAKTGTAEYGADPVGTHAWLVATRDNLAVAVFVADGRSGARDAGPLMRDFLSD
ncbi:cell division protein FtsI/penicillin-binding protein 2 [Naumannella cuiyingiana]|uniref:Cell division protein FtsI/penicillin-binding protein 2 n=1 Tax=Naumannella cuiyingiana TaxID=1347891 RepID=A0A7Z0ILI0_9ACTN|nr:cell division protein FtsI/penicillin-binding protein 2 [Naumannella cuiyingiana]